jgi:hypothetical protein
MLDWWRSFFVVEYQNDCSVMMFHGDHLCLMDGHRDIVVVEKGGWASLLPSHCDDYASMVDPKILRRLYSELYCEDCWVCKER